MTVEEILTVWIWMCTMLGVLLVIENAVNRKKK